MGPIVVPPAEWDTPVAFKVFCQTIPLSLDFRSSNGSRDQDAYGIRRHQLPFGEVVHGTILSKLDLCMRLKMQSGPKVEG